VDLTSYDLLSFVYPRTSNCPWLAVAINGYAGSALPRTFLQDCLYCGGHEITHNFGIGHTMVSYCVQNGEPVPIGGTCTRPRTDVFDVMGGGGQVDLNVWAKLRLGWLAPTDVPVVAESGVYDIANLSATGGLRGLRIRRNASQYFYLETRAPELAEQLRHTCEGPLFQGLTIRLAPDPSVQPSGVENEPALLDAHPGTGRWDDAPLLPGETFTDPSSGVAVTLLERTSAGARVHVSLDSQAPPAYTEPSKPDLGLAGQLRTEYFDNSNLAGEPVAVSTDSEAIDFDWGSGSPHPMVPDDSFSVRWEGTIVPSHDATYTLQAFCDDGVRLWIDDEPVIDNWRPTLDTLRVLQSSVALEAGRHYNLRMEYFKESGRAKARLLWSADGKGCEPIRFGTNLPPAESEPEESEEGRNEGRNREEGGANLLGACAAAGGAGTSGGAALLLLSALLVLYLRDRLLRPRACRDTR
jgi:hypothetical protein